MKRKSPTTEAVTGRNSDRDERIRSLYIDGRHSDREIAEALGLHRVTVTRRRLALGIRPEDRPAAVA